MRNCISVQLAVLGLALVGAACNNVKGYGIVITTPGTPTVTPSPTATPTPGITTWSVNITLPAGYTASSVSNGLVANGTSITGTVNAGTDIAVTATHPCYADISISETVNAAVTLSPSQGAAKNFAVTFTSNLSGVTFSPTSPATLGCGNHSVTGSKGGYSDVTVNFTVAGSDMTVPVDFLTFTPTLPTHAGSKYGVHDSAMRTLSFVTNADSVQCSHNNGSAWGACDSASTLIWATADYAGSAVMKVKASKAGNPDYTYTYTPATAHPGLTFYACDSIVSVDEDFNTFEARLAAGISDKTICIAPGVTILNNDTIAQDRIDIGGSNFIIIGSDVNKPKIHNQRLSSVNNNSALRGISGPYLTLINLKIISEGGGATALELNGGENALYGVEIQSNGASAYGFKAGTNSGAGTIMDHSSIVATYTALWANQGTTNLTITNSTIISGGYEALQANGYATVSVTDSLLQTIGGSNYSGAFWCYDGAVVTLTDSVVQTDKFGLWLGDGFAAGAAKCTLTINNTVVRHAGGAAGDNGMALYLKPASTAHTINSSGVNNTFCNVAAGQARSFITLKFGTGTYAGTFNDASYSVLAPCP